jgi:hypothetical protein
MLYAAFDTFVFFHSILCNYLLAAMAGVFAATDSAVANVRETKDAWNSVAAGCAAGVVAGGFQRSAQTMVFGCVGMGAMMGAFDLSGSSLKVYIKSKV